MNDRNILLRRHLNPLILLILLSFLTACTTLEVGIERTPTANHAATATVATPSATFAAPTSASVLALGRLAYLQGGDIWVKGLPDGKPQRLTADGRNREPCWSPSGQWLAFRKNDFQVWVMRADGSAARPLNEGALVRAFAWAPKADRLAYLTGTGALVAQNSDGSSQQELVTQGSGGSYTGVVSMAWSPNGRLLAYAAVRASPNATGDGKTVEHALDGRAIYIVNPQTGETRVLTHPGDAVDGWPQWSADGTRLLYTRQHDGYADVRVVTLEGSRDELLVTGLADPMCYYSGCGWWRVLAYRP